jgi:peptidoglycan/xylan/chitin deacetylase (PgdA/CDA1 family)
MSLTVVTYHYVRRLAESRYPKIRGLELDAFEKQLEYICGCYTPVTGEDVINAVKGRGTLPSNAVLLTFDDGYLDHYKNVFPILLRKRLKGIFFPSALSVIDAVMLDVNKLHYLLASADEAKIMAKVDSAVLEAQDRYSLPSMDEYRRRYFVAGQFDTPDVVYVKRMLQIGLPRELRLQILDELFGLFVSADEKEFARELYMDVDQVRCLVEAGMMVGSHGYSHEWLDHLSPVEQASEIELSLQFLKGVGVGSEWSLSYPHGAWSHGLLDILRLRGCAVGFTIEPMVAELHKHDPLLLPRVDTNYLPKAVGQVPGSRGLD